MDESGAGRGRGRRSCQRVGADRISSLSDDLLLDVLLHLGYAGDAARTSLLSLRWRGLYTLLPEVDITLRDVPLGSLETTLRRAAHSRVRHLDIAVPRGGRSRSVDVATISSVLRAAERLSPLELRFVLPRNLTISPTSHHVDVAVDLPCFNRATSIELYARRLPLTYSHGFPALETLILSGCHLHLATVIPRCPRLRVLMFANDDDDDVSIHSSSLQDLVVESRIISPARIDVRTPVLRRLTMSFRTIGKLRVSVSAPVVRKLSWWCSRILGRWSLSKMSLETTTTTTTEKPHRLASQQETLPRVPICVKDSFRFENVELEYTAETEKHMCTHFSVLELHLKTEGHVYGGFVSHLLGMHHATRSLKIVLLRSKVTHACPMYCPCDEQSIDWRSQDIFLINLEKVEIEDFRTEDHEFDFLNLIFRCAPVLTKVTVCLSKEVKPSDDDCCRKLHAIFMAYPRVECFVDFVPRHD